MSNPFELIDSNWAAVLDQAIAVQNSEVRIICPFIKKAAAERFLRLGRPRKIQVLTRLNLYDFCAGVSDLSALRLLLQNNAEIKGVVNLHAKLYLFGQKRAVVTSANLTEAALNRNHEFGFVADAQPIVQRCHEYFDRLWPLAGCLLTLDWLNSCEARVENARIRGAGPASHAGLPDEGTDVGFGVSSTIDLNPFESLTGPAFVKFFGEGNSRAEWGTSIFEEIVRSGSHWACTYPKNRRPRQVKDDDVMFMARMVRKPNDYSIYGRAVGLRHKDGRDDATQADIQIRPWKARWPHYIRVHDAQFIAGTLTNGISLNRLMNELGSDSLITTQRNALAGAGNTDPRQSVKEHPAVRLSAQAHDWLRREFEAALSRHGELPAADMARLDWPPP